MADIKGTNVAATIAPYTTSDTYATHDEQYGIGGYRTVNTVAEMNAIPAARRKEGMLVNVINDKIYKLDGNNNFVDAKLGGGGGGGDVNTYQVDTTKLNFQQINDGDSATSDHLEECGKIVVAWMAGVIVTYSDDTSYTGMSYGGTLNVTFDEGNNLITFMFPNEALGGIVIYTLDMNVPYWTITIPSGSAWDYANNLAQNGYQKFFNGLLIQWGYNAGSTTNPVTVYMPTSFLNTGYNVYGNIIKNSTDSIVYTFCPLVNINAGSFRVDRNFNSGSLGTSSAKFCWFAIGRWK